MTTLLEEALKKVDTLPQDEQDAIASQILETLAEEVAWKQRFAAGKNKMRALAEEALDEDLRGETRPLNELP